MPEALIEYWGNADFKSNRFVHQEDIALITKKDLEHPTVNELQDYGSYLRSSQLYPRKLHLSLMPQPFIGNIREAKVIVLLLNPGLSAADYRDELEDCDYRNAIRSNLGGQADRHLFLDTTWAWTSGFNWWERKLRGVASILACRKFDNHYGKALDALAKDIACIELAPYHSTSFSSSCLKLPSAKIAQKTAEALSKDLEKTMIITRAVKHWNIDLAPNVICYDKNEARGAHLGPKTRGGQAILRAFGVGNDCMLGANCRCE